MCICLCLWGQACFWPERYYKSIWFLSPSDEISELAWAALRIPYASFFFMISHDICRGSRLSHAVLSSPLDNYLMCHTSTGNGKLLGFQFCPMGGSIAGFRPCLVVMNKIRYKLAKLYSAVVHPCINTFVFNENIYWTHQNNIARKVMVSHLVRKLVLNV